MSKITLPPPLMGTLVPRETFGDVPDPTPEQCATFLELVAMGASMHAAAKIAGLPFISFGREALRNETFARDMQAARLMRAFALEEIAIEQCTVGVEKVLTHQGQVSYHYEENEHGELVRTTKPVTVKKIVTNNRILLALLKAKFPEKYREPSEANVSTRVARPAASTIEEQRGRLLRRLEQGLLDGARPADPDEELKR